MTDKFPETLDFEDISFPSKITLQSKGKLLILDEPWTMGILNITPDSFYQSSRLGVNGDKLLDKAALMIEEGADILDIGGYSTRPGAKEISVEEEMDRVIPSIQSIKKTFPEVILSVDTFRSKVAKNAVYEGADIVNDISAGQLDEAMLEQVGKLNVPYIAMHSRGNPQTMQQHTDYKDILTEILQYFAKKTADCKKAGIKDVIIDPGLGFAKTLDQNYWILKNLSYFKIIQRPILAGVSRKSMIYKILDIGPDEALNGTTALHMVALIQGAKILRVHDVKEAKQTIQLYKKLYT
jgi:dihydropteroate synthase